MSTIPQEYLTEFDFGFNAIDEIPQTTLPQPSQQDISDVEGITDNITRIEQKVDSVIHAIGLLGSRLTDLNDDIDIAKEATTQEVQNKLTQLEKMILPLLVNLMKNPEKDYIHWPNRSPMIQAQIDKVLAITRS